MKKLTLLITLLSCTIFSLPLYAAEYTLPSAYDFFISRQAEKNDNLPQYIKPDYIRDDYKRVLPDLDNSSLGFLKVCTPLMTLSTHSSDCLFHSLPPED